MQSVSALKQVPVQLHVHVMVTRYLYPPTHGLVWGSWYDPEEPSCTTVQLPELQHFLSNL